MRVEQGTVVSFRPVTLGGGDRGGATVVGGLTGGAVGSQFGGRGVDHATFGIAGAVLGALAGNAIAKNNEVHGFAYVINFRDGSTVEIPQADPEPIPAGTRVFVSYGDRVRVRPAGPGETLPPPPEYRGRGISQRRLRRAASPASAPAAVLIGADEGAAIRAFVSAAP